MIAGSTIKSLPMENNYIPSSFYRAPTVHLQRHVHLVSTSGTRAMTEQLRLPRHSAGRITKQRMMTMMRKE
ncbi:hypothetical protein CPB84DRAFT_1766549 [Gymnopilus junonius]|uniref:Uncharacterized protein n=1 Tax=Gymnopilus junonius TaxID=109634 RepID=A0A9P5NTW3_GYMJU|nr:hypothetical protein CPB84DRAFT_1766549 [Gymnopilus junonius]